MARGLLGSLLLGSLLLGSCSGPPLQLEHAADERVFVDGKLEPRRELPFRYYGVTQIDVLPPAPVDDELPDLRQRETRTMVRILPPAKPWLFPFDLPLEFYAWLRQGQQPTRVAPNSPGTTTVRPAAPEVLPGVQPLDLREINERAVAARISR